VPDKPTPDAVTVIPWPTFGDAKVAEADVESIVTVSPLTRPCRDPHDVMAAASESSNTLSDAVIPEIDSAFAFTVTVADVVVVAGSYVPSVAMEAEIAHDPTRTIVTSPVAVFTVQPDPVTEYVMVPAPALGVAVTEKFASPYVFEYDVVEKLNVRVAGSMFAVTPVGCVNV